MHKILIIALMILSCQTFSQVQEFTLNNGLKVLVKEDHRAPIAVSMIWYNVGSADEPGGLTGISHAIEHMMFKGTTQYPLGVFSKTIAALGGNENAITNNDYTAYFEKIAAKNLSLSMKLEADRMQNLILDANEFAKEIKVIQEERRMRTEDNPQALALERFLAAAHLTTPYHQPVIGWMNDLQHLTIDDVKLWYHRFYAPNHATLVVVGDVKPKEVFYLAEKFFGPLTKRESYTHKPQVEPPPLGKKSIEVHGRVQVPLFIRGYTVPSVKSATSTQTMDPYALELIATLLGGGDSARLQRHLIRQTSCASHIGVQYNLYTRYESEFIIYAMPSQTCSLKALDQAIQAEIQTLKTELVSADELDRVKTQLIAQKTFERDSIFSQAMEIGMVETIGLSSNIISAYETRLKQISRQDIQETIKQYFNSGRQTDAQLIPIKPKAGAPA